MPQRDLTKQAQSVLRILQNAQQNSERVTLIKLLEAWHGKGSKNLKVSDLPRPELSPVDCQRFVIHLVLERILNEDFHFTPYSTISYLVPGIRAAIVLDDKTSVKMETLDNDFSQVRKNVASLLISLTPEMKDAALP